MNELNTKSKLLEDLFGQPDIYEEIGSAWRIFMLLLTVENGTMVTTYAEAGKRTGAGEKTMRNWICELEKNGIINKVNKGHGIRISLCEPYMSIAQSPDYIVKETDPSIPEEFDDPKMKALIDAGRIAFSHGSSVELKMVI